MRRAFLIVATLIVLAGIGAAFYFFFFAKHPTLTASSGTPFVGTQSGNAPTNTNGNQPEALGVSIPAGNEVAPKLVKITSGPVAKGFAAVYIPPLAIGTTTASSTAQTTPPEVRVDYIDRQSGNIYQFQAHARTLTRVTNKTLPGIEEASWTADGALAFARFLETGADHGDHIDTYALPSNGSDGYFLQQDLAEVRAGASSSVFTLLSTGNGSTGTLAHADGTSVHAVFSSPLSAISVAFAGSNFIATTKPSAQTNGYAFQVDGKTGSFLRVLGPLLGLDALPSPSGRYLLYSSLYQGKLFLALLDTTTHESVALPLSTLAEKCAWTADSAQIYCGVPKTLSGTLPDDWYQGAVGFTDRLWRIDPVQHTATLLIDPFLTAQASIDMVGLTLDRTSDVIVFMNRNDGSLWMYDL